MSTSEITGLILILLTIAVFTGVYVFQARKSTDPEWEFYNILRERGLTVYLERNPKGARQSAKSLFLYVSGKPVTLFIFSTRASACQARDLHLYGHSAIQNGNLLLLEKQSHPKWRAIKEAFYCISNTEEYIPPVL